MLSKCLQERVAPGERGEREEGRGVGEVEEWGREWEGGRMPKVVAKMEAKVAAAVDLCKAHWLRSAPDERE
jgi:hypothetical protein